MNGICLLLTLGIGQAAAPPPPAENHLKKLVSQLGSGQFNERQNASALLEKLGAAAVPSLREAGGNPDPEVRGRAEALLARIERRLESARVLAGKKIALSYRDTPGEEAWHDFGKRTGFILTPDKERPPDLGGSIVNLKTGDIAVWEALDRFCAALGVSEVEGAATGTDGPAIVLRAGRPDRGPTCYAGGVRVSAFLEPSQGWGQTAGVTEVPINLRIAAEPGIAWERTIAVHVDRAVDENGQVLETAFSADFNPPSDYTARERRSLQKAWALSSDPETVQRIQLKLGEHRSRSLKEMRGTIIGRVQTPPALLVEVEAVLKSQGRSFSGADGCRLRIAEINRDDAVVKIAVEYELPVVDDVPFPVWPQNQWRMNRLRLARIRGQMESVPAPHIELQDSAGRAFESARYNEASESDGTRSRYTSTIHFLAKPALGAPARLILIGRRTAAVEVPFTLSDVPLP